MMSDEEFQVMDIEIDSLAVLGAGSMGHGIAEVAAIAGYNVVMRDVEQDIVREGYEQIEWSVGKLAEKGRIDDDPMSSSIVSRRRLIRDSGRRRRPRRRSRARGPRSETEIFSAVDAAASSETIIATNTSSLRVSDIAAAVDQPERCCGLHFFNPPVKMDLVEVVSGEATNEVVTDTAYTFVESIDKTPIRVRKDIPQFVVNNVLTPYMGEAAWMFDAGAASIREIDAAMVFQRGYPMGPFELNDFGGLDIFAHTREQWDEPVPESVSSRIEDDDLGRKTGKGFYDYEDSGVDYEPGQGEGVDTVRIEARMINEAAKLVGQEVAVPEDIDTGMRLGGGLPEGTCRTADKIGLDVALEKLRDLHDATGAERYEPADYLIELVEAGHTGEDAGRGFYDYNDGGPYHYVRHELSDDGVLSVIFDREERLNAFSTDMFDEVKRLLTSVDTEEVSCVVFEGAGDRASALARTSPGSPLPSRRS